MKTIYVKRNFPVILASIGCIISFIYFIDYYWFQLPIVTSPEMGRQQIRFEIASNPDNLSHNSGFMSKSNSTTMFIKESSSSEENRSMRTCSVTIALILCEADQYLSLKIGRNQSGSPNLKKTKPPPPELPELSSKPPPLAKNFGRQVNQTLVLLKSLAIQTLYDPGIRPRGDCVNVIVLSDRKSHFDKIRDKIRSEWAPVFQRTLNLTFSPVKYPTGSGWMRKMFRPCATLRLFLPELLPQDIESIVYVDTDFIFLRSVQSLLTKFFGPEVKVNKGLVKGQSKVKGQERSKQVLAGMGPCLFHYGTKSNLIPYYGSSGLNAGLMLMNLSRMRESLWTNKIRMVTAMFQHEIKLADQDILNIYFHFFPAELVPLTCDWNFRPFQCREGNYCEDANLAGGISALHGNALSFTPSGPEPLFYTVFKVFHDLKLDDHFSLERFVEELETKLLEAEEELHSDCVRYGGFSVMVLNRLDKLVRVMDLRDRDNEVVDDGGGDESNFLEDVVFEYEDDNDVYTNSKS